MSDRPPRLRIVGLTKSFGGTHALRDVDLEVGPGEVHGLIGENSAGKSTLIRCATGVIRPDAGRIEVDSREQGEEHRGRRGASLLTGCP